MKKPLSLLLLLCLLLGLAVPARAEDAEKPDTLRLGDLTVTWTGCSLESNEYGTSRLELLIQATNNGTQPCTLRAASCRVYGFDLPTNLLIRLEPGQSGWDMAVVSLSPLKYLELAEKDGEKILLCLELLTRDGETESVRTEDYPLQIPGLSETLAREAYGQELFRRFGARLLSLGSEYDGRYLTSWFLLENNNDWPIEARLRADGLRSTSCGGRLRPHSAGTVRLDVPMPEKSGSVSLVLQGELAAYMDGQETIPSVMGAFQAGMNCDLPTEKTLCCEMSLETEGEALYEQSFFGRVGNRDFSYDAHGGQELSSLKAQELPRVQNPLESLVRCAGYEILAGEEQNVEVGGEYYTQLPLLVKNYTGDEELTLSVRQSGDGLWLPCLTTEKLCAVPANGSALYTLNFAADGLAYTELAGEQQIVHSFTLCAGPWSDPALRYGEDTVAHLTTVTAELPAREPFDQPEQQLGALSVSLLGMELSDGLSLWLRVKNTSDTDLLFCSRRMEAMLDSTAFSLYHSSPRIPANSNCLVLLHSAVWDEETDTPDLFAWKTPPLSELNTLKIRSEENSAGTQALTILFQKNGNILYASFDS